MLLVFVSTTLFGQTNNPYDSQGIQYINSLSLIRDDFFAGKATEFNDATLSYYSRQVPLRNKVSVDLAATVVNNMKDPVFSYTTAIDRSSLSGFSKNTLKTVITNEHHLDNSGYQADLVSRTNDVLTAAIPATEKEFVLSLIAIAYHTADPGSSEVLANGRQRGCWINGPYGSGPGTREQCIAAGALIGGVIGYSICGILCGLGGAIVGGVAGALS